MITYNAVHWFQFSELKPAAGSEGVTEAAASAPYPPPMIGRGNVIKLRKKQNDFRAKASRSQRGRNGGGSPRPLSPSHDWEGAGGGLKNDGENVRSFLKMKALSVDSTFRYFRKHAK